MKKLRGIGNLGLSLVELIISMAILAVVGTAIGGAMYVSSRSYTRGAAEVNVQEEAQVASNLICDWIVDATSVNPDGSGGFTEGSSTSLVIIHPEGDDLVEITVSQSGDELVYVAKNADASDPDYGTVVASGTLAKNLTGCNFYSTFGTDRNVKISLDFNINERTYRAVTDSTSRSHDFISTGGTSTLGAPSIRFLLVSNTGGAHVTLEPGQNTANSQYTFYVVVDNCDVATLNAGGVTYTAPASAKTDIVSCDRVGTTNKWKVVVRSHADAEGDDVYFFNVANVAGSDSKPLTVKIRRVNECAFSSFTIDPTTSRHYWPVHSGTVGSQNSTYTNVINLDADNWQEETNITGANISVIGENGFDAAPWNYINPTGESCLSVNFMKWNGSKYVSAASDATYTITPGANPTLNVKLTHDIDYEMAVVVVATHSGSITGNPNSQSDPHMGVSAAANNKPKALDGANFSYGPGGEAYYDVIWIGQGNGHIHDVGGGVRRGVPACMIAVFDSQFKTQLVNDLKAKTGYTNETQISNDNGSRIKYSTVIEYQEVLPNGSLGPVKRFVISNFTNYSQIWSDYIAQRIRDAQTQIFQLDRKYEITYYFDVFVDGEKKLSYPATGSVCAATPYIYDHNRPAGDTVNFKNGKYTQDNPYSMTSSQSFGVYIDGVGLNGDKIDFICEYLDTTTNTWKPVSNIVGWNSKQWAEGSETIGGVTYSQVHLSDGRTYTVGAYNENQMNLNNSRCNLEFIDINRSNMTSGVLYRVRFYTDWKEASSIQYGHENGSSDDVGKVLSYTYKNYTLDGDFYFTKG